ncbi:uncharacterized protein LY89DRAFT_769833 [Mollisia scopiformis]|uniref:Alpha box domain-containing protein n=1 Tax=Mollisia scopiformis TaxID=149040 RepID=A0A132B1X1_MOLSC|nr:uncharacterized protein LY89DRAFT_769833 [Mollisia scopiformis]KUJ06233.1 hypothetical protein LY89DRAFT_769833 [Mollisia scopiformis]
MSASASVPPPMQHDEYIEYHHHHHHRPPPPPPSSSSDGGGGGRHSRRVVVVVPPPPPPPPPRTRKALNSWMAFRAYYRSIFAPFKMQQKDASRHLTVLWRRDPFKARWAVIAAAYSRIRDQVGKPDAPLSGYLAIVCPRMGIVDSERYLRSSNNKLNYWAAAGAAASACRRQVMKKKDDDDGLVVWQQQQQHQELDPARWFTATFDHHHHHHDTLYSSMLTSIDDIVEFCASLGYISRTSFVALQRAHHLANGSSSNNRSSSPNPSSSNARQGLLVSGPPTTTTTLAAVPPNSAAPPSTLGIAPAAIVMHPAVSGSFLGVNSIPISQNLPLQQPWTGNMSEVYFPAVGSADFERAGLSSAPQRLGED